MTTTPVKKKPNRGPGFTCVFCQKHFSGSTSQPIHIRRHIREKPYNCRHCDFNATCITDVYLHERKIHVSEAEQCKCAFCGRVYKNSFNLKAHFRTAHASDANTSYICLVCGREFQNKSYFTQHMKVHSGDTRKSGKQKSTLKCALCNSQFANEVLLRNHLEKNSDCSGSQIMKKSSKSPVKTKTLSQEKPIRRRNLKDEGQKKEHNLKIVNVYSLEDQ